MSWLDKPFESGQRHRQKRLDAKNIDDITTLDRAHHTAFKDVAFINIIGKLLPSFEPLSLGKREDQAPVVIFDILDQDLNRLADGQLSGVTEFLNGNEPFRLKTNVNDDLFGGYRGNDSL